MSYQQPNYPPGPPQQAPGSGFRPHKFYIRSGGTLLAQYVGRDSDQFLIAATAAIPSRATPHRAIPSKVMTPTTLSQDMALPKDRLNR
ncbi:hypothetical protein N7457_006496 [Penicillium paradoxum]|uniref:uncharacterized protein n=1 Tax=Penicillium paradoxum TaxID=176176 RepID=UPI0025489D13|nr:uncharacterized protein N7457_006496 [Penicillium paradoxum]KAJ5781336.1 hypothetical protein N7457_006496 [Penicillium paradoxum]